MVSALDLARPSYHKFRSIIAPIPQEITHAAVTLSVEEDMADDRFQMGRLKKVASIVYQLEGNVLVFVPESVKLDAMVMTLREAGVLNAFKLKALIGMSQEFDRTVEMDELLAYESQINPKKKTHPYKMDQGHSAFAISRGLQLEEALEQGEHKVMVCKENRARGMDFKDLRYVVLFDIPGRHVDYQHLAGRTGRMGQEGTCISVVSRQQRGEVLPRLAMLLGIKFQNWDIEAAEVISKPERSAPKDEAEDSKEAKQADDEAPPSPSPAPAAAPVAEQPRQPSEPSASFRGRAVDEKASEVAAFMASKERRKADADELVLGAEKADEDDDIGDVADFDEFFMDEDEGFDDGEDEDDDEMMRRPW